MPTLIERYVYDVVRRLPERDREEISRELTANIYDMLPEASDNATIEAVLNKLGSPRVLADGYRQKPNYLVSPALYDTYIHTLKWVVPFVGVMLFIIGIISGAFKSIEGSSISTVTLAVNVMVEGVSVGVSGVVHALVWTTVGFVVADRVSPASTLKDENWSIAQLPPQIENTRNRISLSDSIAEAVLCLVFTTAAILLLMETIPLPLVANYQVYGIHAIFTPSFIAVCIPALILACLITVAEDIIKIIVRRWSPLVCVTVLASNVFILGIIAFLAFQPEIFSTTLLSFVAVQEWWPIQGQQGNSLLAQIDFEQLVAFVVFAIALIAALAECGYALYKTIRAVKS